MTGSAWLLVLGGEQWELIVSQVSSDSSRARVNSNGAVLVS